MHYTTETLDRRTGDLKLVSIGDWITVTELGQRHNVGPRRVRAVLSHMSLLQSEGRRARLRLQRWAVTAGLGKRIDTGKKLKFPFDVISPAGQSYIAERWNESYAAIDKTNDPEVERASALLASFKEKRSSMTTQEEVCWLKDHCPSLTHDQIALVLEVTPPLVARYAGLREDQLRFRRWWRVEGAV